MREVVRVPERSRRELLLGGMAAVGVVAAGCRGVEPARPSLMEIKGVDQPEGVSYTGLGTLFVPPLQGAAPASPAQLSSRAPEWFRRTSGIYVPAPYGMGGVPAAFANGPRSGLSDTVDGYGGLVRLVQDAQSMGTETILLSGWWDDRAGHSAASPFVPKEQWGGERALVDAIDAVHRQGGRVLFVLPALLLSGSTDVAREHGAAWSLTPDEPRLGGADIQVCPAAKGWQVHLAEVAKRLVRYGADGVYLDGLGEVKNRLCLSSDHGHEAEDRNGFNEGARLLVERIQHVMLSVNSDAIVVAQAPKLPRLFQHISAAMVDSVDDLSRSWAWNQGGRSSFFSAGWSLDDMHQILAMGHKWVLSPYWARPPVGSLRGQLDDRFPPVPEYREERARRAQGDAMSRELNRWRNGAILAGRRVPSIDAVCSRRGADPEVFRDDVLFADRVDRMRSVADELEEGLSGPERFHAAVDHLRSLAEARKRLSPVFDDGGATMHLHTVDMAGMAYGFDGPNGKVLTLVNTSDQPIVFRFSAGRWGMPLRDELDGDRFAAKEPVVCPGHRVRMLRVG